MQNHSTGGRRGRPHPQDDAWIADAVWLITLVAVLAGAVS